MGNQTAEVQSAVAVLGSLHGLLDDLVVGKLALLDGQVDADNILPDDTSSTNVQVSDLGVAHQTLGQTDSKGRSLELGITGGTLGEAVHNGGVGVGDGIAVLGGRLGGNSPAVNHDCTYVELSVSASTTRDRSE